ncbi:MAG: PfkB family carbohydrate kinase [Ignavibacteria bacterium]|nr:PfkB family carbohydrate kinase [Ignavibacteria bacterium]
MSLLVVGSIALDTIETPFGKREYILGGSASFICLTSSYFTKDIRMVGIVGYDFPKGEIDFFRSKGIDTSGIEISPIEKTFHWYGKYHDDMNTRDSIVTELNAFEKFNPIIPENFRDSDFICIGNVDPRIQKSIILQIKSPKIIMMDTMNFWIEGKLNELLDTLKFANILVINDSEVKLLTKDSNIISGGRKIFELGPEIIIIKKGEHGAILMTKEEIFTVPAIPLERIVDPTGAGDTFAGGLMGWLHRTKDLSFENLKLAVVMGTVMASIAVEDYSIDNLRNVEKEEINKRINKLHKISNFNRIELN